MARLKGNRPKLDSEEVLRFFEARALGADIRDHYSVTSFADRSTAEERHLSELALALPLLNLPDIHANVLDIGCGGGRWARSLAEIGSPIASYHGFDFSPKVLDLAIGQKLPCWFTFERRSVDEFVVHGLNTERSWTHVLIVAVSLYLNDDTVSAMLSKIAETLALGGKVYLREGVVTDGIRLTLLEEPSEALRDCYSAVYRTVSEYEEIIRGVGLSVLATGRLPDGYFTRHPETTHQYFLCGFS
jgi:SAM-dependent methyltransferase